MLKILLNKIEELILENLLKSLIVLYFVSITSFMGIILVFQTEFQDKLFRSYKNNDIEITSNDENGSEIEKIQVEISGAVKKPGVFELDQGSRLVNLLNEAGGFSSQSSTEWIIKNINLSTKLEDSQKVYIPYVWDTVGIGTKDEESDLVALVKPIVSSPIVEENQENQISDPQENGTLVNVNTASQEDIDALPGIGPVYAARIIENRPYQDLTGFEEASGVPGGVIDDIKNLISF